MAARLVDECLEEARNAREVAAALDRFVEQVVECAAEITGAISELFAIASVCGKLALAINSARFSRMLYVIDSDLDLALSSLSVSLVHIFQKFKRLSITPNLNGASYRRVWREMRFMFHEEGLTPGPCDMNILRSQIQMIYEYQQPMKIMLRACVPRGTSVRQRRLSTGGIQSRPATAPPSREWVGPYSPPPMPIAPEIPVVPLSPTSTHSSTSSGASTVSHWACRVFDGRHSETRLKSTGQSSKCLGLAMSTLGLSRQDMEVVELLFFCTFTALRAYGPADPMAEPSEFQLDGEIEHYGGSWLKRVRPKVIRLKDLRQYIFSHDYEPRRERGEFELIFRSSQGIPFIADLKLGIGRAKFDKT
ncbi:hypothetical protein FGG08_004096 [Glutinoglossum americanum]|uniref:Uncharacterized protein n=1 Tax=Glutinoglossum americanum TaxID=1670608 RepID=A0A9P8I2Z5_9PEZI|nr:hypothetical protein FGG08_004096 [Glutinoglossum americanum]